MTTSLSRRGPEGQECPRILVLLGGGMDDPFWQGTDIDIGDGPQEMMAWGVTSSLGAYPMGTSVARLIAQAALPAEMRAAEAQHASAFVSHQAAPVQRLAGSVRKLALQNVNSLEILVADKLSVLMISYDLS
jgi:hypothetical protein